MRRLLSTSLQIAFLLAICCSTFTAAHADSTTYYDDLWCDEYSGCVATNFPQATPPSQTMTSYELSFGGSGFKGDIYHPPSTLIWVNLTPFSPSPSVTNFNEQIDCDNNGCSYRWGGDFSGGIVTASETLLYRDLSHITIDFTGTVTGGVFNETYGDHCSLTGLACYREDLDLDFSGEWSNGWTSYGSISMGGDSTGDFGGRMFLYTVVPEPGSLILFSSGIVVLAGLLRRRLVPRG